MPMIEFTVVAEKLFVDDELSMDGLELLAGLVARANNGPMSLSALIKIRNESTWDNDTFSDLLEELIEHGYIRYLLPTERRSEQRQWMVRPIHDEQSA